MDHAKNFSSQLNEFVRYCLAGGMAFCVDFGVLVLSSAALPRMNGFELYAAAALGFLAGMAVHYVLSVRFVFRFARRSGAGRSVRGFFIFAAIGAVGLGLTEAGMYAGTALLRLHYMPVKVAVSAVVLIWNYLGRKIFVFGREK